MAFDLAGGWAAQTPPPATLLKKSLAHEALTRAIETHALAANTRLGQTLRSDDPSGPHRLRVALRRIRTTLWVFRPWVRPGPTEILAAAARDVGRRAGVVRELDVIATQIVPAASATLDPAALSLMTAHLEARRRAARERFALQGCAVEAAAFLLLSHRYLAESLWRPERGKATRKARARLAGRASELAPERLKRAWKRVAGYGARLESLSIDERHEMRKGLKRLRYTAELFAPLYRKKRVAAYLGQLADLQDVFGYLNDVAGAERLRMLADEGPAADRAHLHAVGEAVIAHHQSALETAWGSAITRWRDLAATRPFWRI